MQSMFCILCTARLCAKRFSQLEKSKKEKKVFDHLIT